MKHQTEVLTYPNVFGAVLSAAGLIVAVWPAFFGPAVFSQDVATKYLEFLALTWTAVFTAGNLLELKEARIADLLPLLDIDLRRGYEDGKLILVLTVKNIGKGHAMRLRITTYEYDRDGLVLLDQDAMVPRTLAPLDDAVVKLPNDWVKYSVLEKDCDLIVDVMWSDAFGEGKVRRTGFKIGTFDENISRVKPPGDKPRLDLKLDAVRKHINQISAEYQLANRGESLVVDIDDGMLVVNYIVGTESRWTSLNELSASASSIEGTVRRAMKRLTELAAPTAVPEAQEGELPGPDSPAPVPDSGHHLEAVVDRPQHDIDPNTG